MSCYYVVFGFLCSVMILWYSLGNYCLFGLCGELVKVAFLFFLILVFCVVKFLVSG